MVPGVGGIYAQYCGNVVFQNTVLYASNGVAFGTEYSTAAVTFRCVLPLPPHKKQCLVAFIHVCIDDLTSWRNLEG
jgi:hypothetical protein